MRKSKIMFWVITALMVIMFISGAIWGLREYYLLPNSNEGTDVSEEMIYIYQDELSGSEPVAESHDYAPGEDDLSKDFSINKDDFKDNRMNDSVNTGEKYEESNDNPIGLKMHAEKVSQES